LTIFWEQALSQNAITSTDASVFDYAQMLVELMFIVTVLSSILVAVLPFFLSEGMFSGSLANSQLNSLMVNMQRTFADTVTSFVTDVQTRKLIVLLGLCMLPSISSAVSGSQQKVFATIKSLFLAPSKKRDSSSLYASFIAKLWIAGLSMAWMNTALGFILPQSSSSSLSVWMRVVSTACLAVLSRSLQPMFPGLEMFQSYIEWNIARSALSLLQTSSGNQMTALYAVFFSGLAFYALDALYRDIVRQERQQDAKKARLSAVLQTLQSVSIIMFTNSLVSWAMQVISGGGLGNAFATVTAGIVVARTIVQVVAMSQ
jgi:hypothetical protein